jgi:hypothetical protein
MDQTEERRLRGEEALTCNQRIRRRIAPAAATSRQIFAVVFIGEETHDLG